MIKKDDHYFMRLALIQAKKAFLKDEVPVGALVINDQYDIIGRGYNKVEQRHQQNAHAEMIAIAHASKKIGNWRLNGCWLYVTLEPCMMCFGLIQLSRLQGIVFGAPSRLFARQLDKYGVLSLYNKGIEVREGVLVDEAIALLKQFFKQKRTHK